MNVLEKILEEISIIKTRYESGNHSRNRTSLNKKADNGSRTRLSSLGS